MTSSNFSYLLFEVALLILAILVLYATGGASTLRTRSFLRVSGALYAAWITWDLLAVRLNVFIFPSEGNLPWRLAGLPLEEHLFFPLHLLSCWAAIWISKPSSATIERSE